MMDAARFVLGWAFAVAVALQRQSPCDPLLLSSSADPQLAYQDRENGARCEGLYARPQNARVDMALVSLTRVFSTHSEDTGALQLSWGTPGARGPVLLRANSLRYKVYYRMDAVAADNQSRFSWPTQILTKVDVRRQELGVLAWVAAPVLGSSRSVYLPIRVDAADTPAAADAIVQAVVTPSVELSQLFVTLRYVDEKSKKQTTLLTNKPLELVAYPAERAVRVPLRLQRQGYYHATLNGSVASGGSVATDFWLFHDGR